MAKSKSKAAAAKTPSREDTATSEDKNTTGGSTSSTKSSKKRSGATIDFEILEREMELADYDKNETGQRLARVRRKEQKHRTIKRKRLEREEAHEFETIGEAYGEQRLRGSLAANQEDVVQASSVFEEPTARSGEAEEDEEEDDDGDDDDEDNEEGEGDNDNENGGKNFDHDSSSKSKSTTPSQKAGSKKRPSTRKLYRLKNFQSQRLARRHGEAMGAHARGDHKGAIEQLKAIAKLAPSAPQVYSSLGLVYEDMLKVSQKRREEKMEQSAVAASTSEKESHSTGDSNNAPTSTNDTNQAIPDPYLAEQLQLAQKAYGSYHIAAVLCRKDFNLWVRSADMGWSIGDLHTEIMTLPGANATLRKYHKGERQRWLAEALRDYVMADNLKPPGIDVPAKLAATHIELGNLSEALTILTDLKNRYSASEGRRSEFQDSYKGWMLYADLMLRIGHEIIQWNDGIQTNPNYMFRRWLRKWSTTFDWQERRLQALSMALRAAAGSKCTRNFMLWTKERAASKRTSAVSTTDQEHVPHIEAITTESGKSVTFSPELSSNGASTVDEENTTGNNSAQFEEEKRLLLEKNASELEAFDRTTKEMELPQNSAAQRKRHSDREGLVARQRSDVVDFVGDYHQRASTQAQVDNGDEIETADSASTSISASCPTVINIASELMKHLHLMGLNEGGKLVGETVSSYLKERAALRDKRVSRKERLDSYHANAQSSVMCMDDFNEDESSDEEDNTPYLSDDDALDGNEDPDLLNSLRAGALPPEIRVLFSLFLMCLGGWNFVAEKCFEAIDLLEQEDCSWLTTHHSGSAVDGDSPWSLFCLSMTEPLGRIAAFTLTADILRKNGRDHEWGKKLAAKFQGQIDVLRSNGVIAEVMSSSSRVLSPLQRKRQNQVLKLIIASSNFQIMPLSDAGSLDNPKPQTVQMAISAIKGLASILNLFWKVEADGTLTATSREAVRIFSLAFNWLACAPTEAIAYSDLTSAMSTVMKVLSYLSGGTVPHELQVGTPIDESMKTRAWGTSYPVDAKWQPDGFRSISLRSYNLCVGCNVSVFSGWEPEEFTFRLLKRKYGERHFGVHIEDGLVSGCLKPSDEREIASQWQEMAVLLPTLPEFDYNSHLSKVKNLDWYKTGQKHYQDLDQSPSESDPLGEAEGLKLYLAFSRLCLKLAKSSSEGSTISNQAIQASLSVLLPVTQFTLNCKVWDSDIGEAANSLSGFESWRNSTALTAEVKASDALPPSRKPGFKRNRVVRKPIEKKVKEWIEGSDKPALQSLVVVPVTDLLSMWNECSSKAGSEVDRDQSKSLMKKVHSCMEKLRKCTTDTAVEKTTLQVAAALLELSENPFCYNPFLCMQQAAVYACQASKGGNSDTYFRRPIPKVTLCSPRDALVILGRADCLHSLHFSNEAAFLCNFVGKVCKLYRNTPGWNARWKVVAIYAYNVSVMIRSTVNTVLGEDAKKSFLHAWDREVVEELEKGRTDALRWKRTRNQTSAVGAGSDDSADEEDEPENENQDFEEEQNDDGDDDDNDDADESDEIVESLPPILADNSTSKPDDDENRFDDIEAVAI